MQKYRKVIRLMTFFVAQFLIFHSALSDPANQVNIKWSITPEGGGRCTSSKFSLFSAFGFHSFGKMTGSKYNLSGGTMVTGVDAFGEAGKRPENFAIHQNYPNPFNPSTTIKFDLPEPATVRLQIFNMLGQQVKQLTNQQYTAGFHELRWNGTDNTGKSVSSGTYIVLIQVQSSKKNVFKDSKRILLVQ